MASGLGPSPIPVLRPQKPLHVPGGDSHRGKSLKLLEKIPEDAEATVVLVGKEAGVLAAGAGGCVCLHCGLPVLSSGLQAASPISSQAPTLPLLFLTICLTPSPFSPNLSTSLPVFCYLALLLIHRVL